MVTFSKAFILQPDEGFAVDRNVQLFSHEMSSSCIRKARLLICTVLAYCDAVTKLYVGPVMYLVQLSRMMKTDQ
jgi:hypothetical protein